MLISTGSLRKGGEDPQLYGERHIWLGRIKSMDQRRDKYDLTMERRDPVFERL
jgi:hypothetical protein